MESSSQVFGGEEECHSSESGWTMYIGSPVEAEEGQDYSDPKGHVDGLEADNFGGEGNNWGTYNDMDANHSDDSMASDASSRPSFRDKTWEIKRGSGRQNEANKVDSRNHSSKYKDKKKTVKKNRHIDEKRINDQDHHQNKEEAADDDDAAATKGANKYLVQGNKVRKNLGWGKQIK